MEKKKKKVAYESHVYLSKEAFEKLQKFAKKENRSLNNSIETIILKFLP